MLQHTASVGNVSHIVGINDLLLTNVTVEDSGVYTCYAESMYGLIYKSAWLTVTWPRGKLFLHIHSVLIAVNIYLALVTSLNTFRLFVCLF